MDTIKTITLIVMTALLATGLYFYTEKETVVTVEATIPVNIDIPENLLRIENNLGAPQVFIATPATSTDPGNFGFSVGTTSTFTLFGTTTHMIYGSSTIQQWDAGIAFRILSPATTTVFSVDTSGNLIISGTCTGCGGSDFAWTPYADGVSTSTLLRLDAGLISAASSTFSVGTTTFAGKLSIGTSTPHQAAMLNIQVDAVDVHGIKITGITDQDEHLVSVENNAGRELFAILNDGDALFDHIADEAGSDALHIDNDINSVADVSAIEISQVLTGLAAEETGTGISVTINTADSASNSTYDALKCFSLGTGSAELTCLAVGTGLSVIHQNVGADINADSVLLASSTFSTFTDITTAANSASTDVEMFVSDDEYLVIRSTGQFEEIKFDLATESSKKIFQTSRTWAHSASGDTWIAFEPSSTINGFEESGVVSMEIDTIGDDWVVSTVNGEGSLFSIRVQRTRNNINTVPIENLIQIAATSTFFWDSNADVGINILYASSTALFDGLSTFVAGFISASSTISEGDLTVTSLGNSIVIGGDSTGAFIQIGTIGQTIPLRFFTPDGVERMRFLSTGFLGIGTTSPYLPLSVVGEGGIVVETIHATGTDATGANIFVAHLSASSTASFASDITIDSGGNILCTTCIPAGSYDAASIDGDDIASSLGGNYITLTAASPDVLDLDPDVVIHTVSFNIATSTMSTSTGVAMYKFSQAVTISRITCYTDTSSTTLQFDDRSEDTPNTGGTDVMQSSLECGSGDGAIATSTFNDATLAADRILNLDLDDPELDGSSPQKIIIHVDYTIDQ